MKNKKLLIGGLLAVIVFAVGCLGIYKISQNNKDNNDNKETISDATKFKEEYTKVGDDNVFVYRNIEEIIKILENGTGVVYLGFPSCPWCQAYVPYLNEVAKEKGISKIYYYNILNDRKEETDNYKKILELLGEYVEYDNEGNKRIYAPTIIFVSNGKIVGMDSETAKDTKGYKDPQDYWTEKRVKSLKDRLGKCSEQVKETVCSDCNK